MIFDLPMVCDHQTTHEGPDDNVTTFTSKPDEFRPIRNLTDPKKVEKWLRYGHLKLAHFVPIFPILIILDIFNFSKKIFLEAHNSANFWVIFKFWDSFELCSIWGFQNCP